MMDLTVKQVSSLEKIRSCGIGEIDVIKRKTVMRGEGFSYQIAIQTSNNMEFCVKVISPLEEHVWLYAVKNSVMDFAVYTDCEENATADDDYITKKPCLMPDLLMPIEYENNTVRFSDEAGALWINVKIPENADAGEYPVTVLLTSNDVLASKDESFEIKKTLILDVIDASLSKKKTIFTQWFHVDCIADVHHVPVYSEAHWELIDKYMALASELGVNMILTPIITPPLDTQVGHRRPSTQLVAIEKKGETYLFDFTLLKRWISLCDKNHIEYFEMAHLFSQWGLKYAPNIEVTENGQKTWMFGWHVDSQSEQYRDFLNQFVPALMEFCKAEGIKERCWFHISDEPGLEHLEAYKYAYDLLKPLIDGCPTLDAISEYEFYQKGLIANPVTATTAIDAFLENKVRNQWAYYCCGMYNQVGNRFLSMPSYRNRILGLQMYKYNIVGFLHWGYNFYYSQHSRKKINPYVTTSADKAYPSGDAFSVYPILEGAAPSLRAFVFKEALDDIEICRMLEGMIGRDEVIAMIDEAAGMEITFSQYPRNSAFIPDLMEKMKRKIKEHIG